MITTERTKFAVIMMVKDEIDVIELALRRWTNAGARVYVCDNGSTDGTTEALIWAATQADIVVQSDDRVEYLMEERINGMKNRAIDDGYNWIIPADPDETWHFWPRDIPEYLDSLPGEGSRWFSVHYFDVSPSGGKRLHTHQKAFGYLDRGCHIHIGNHIISGGKTMGNPGSAIIEHFPIRSRAQMEKKLANHMTAFKAAGYAHHHTDNFEKWKADPKAFFNQQWEIYNFK